MEANSFKPGDIVVIWGLFYARLISKENSEWFVYNFTKKEYEELAYWRIAHLTPDQEEDFVLAKLEDRQPMTVLEK